VLFGSKDTPVHPGAKALADPHAQVHPGGGTVSPVAPVTPSGV
jgi:hypothetical protein